MKRLLAACAIWASLALPAAAQQAPMGTGGGPSNRSSATTTTGPEDANPATGPTGNAPAGQPGTGRYVGGGTGATADCPPGSNRPECQQAAVPETRDRQGSSGSSGSMGTSGGPSDQSQYGGSQTKGAAP